MNIISYFQNNPSPERLRGLGVQFGIIMLSFLSGVIFFASLSTASESSQDVAFISFVPFAVLLAAAIFISFSKESNVLYPDEIDDSTEDDSETEQKDKEAEAQSGS